MSWRTNVFSIILHNFVPLVMSYPVTSWWPCNQFSFWGSASTSCLIPRKFCVWFCFLELRGCPNEPLALAQVFFVPVSLVFSSQLITADMERKLHEKGNKGWICRLAKFFLAIYADTNWRICEYFFSISWWPLYGSLSTRLDSTAFLHAKRSFIPAQSGVNTGYFQGI